MAKRTPRHGMHIKRNTEGSSNELSFSVLDAAKEKLGDRADDQATPAGKVSLFTLGKGKKPRSTPAKSQQIILGDRVRPATRMPRNATAPRSTGAARERRAPAVVPVLVGLCVVVVLALVGYQAWQQVSEQQQDLRSQLSAQIDVLNQVDQVTIPLDDLVMKAADDDLFAVGADAKPELSHQALSSSYRSVVGDIVPARTQLEDVLAYVEGLQTSLTNNRDEEAAHQAVTAAQSRLNMMDAGVKIIDMALMATEAYELAGDGWNKVLEGDTAVREATALMRDMTKENVQASMDQTNTALAAFNDAADLLTRAQAAYPGLDLSAFTTYLDKRIQAQQAALAADQAYLDRDKKTLKKQNARYNKLEDKAAALAKKLTGNPNEAVVELYTGAITAEKQAYEAERQKAGNTDAFLRDYLGTPA